MSEPGKISDRRVFFATSVVLALILAFAGYRALRRSAGLLLGDFFYPYLALTRIATDQVARQSLLLLSRSSRREGVDFTHNRWILFIALAAVTGAVSGLYDKYIMARLDAVFVQSWYNLYQFLMMAVIVAILWWPRRHHTTPFHWSWAIPLISIFLSAADLCYLYALSDSDAMISIVSMIRRGSVIVSFGFGALLFHERNLRAKAVDLLLILVGMFFLWIGSK